MVYRCEIDATNAAKVAHGYGTAAGGNLAAKGVQNLLASSKASWEKRKHATRLYQGLKKSSANSNLSNSTVLIS